MPGRSVVVSCLLSNGHSPDKLYGKSLEIQGWMCCKWNGTRFTRRCRLTLVPVTNSIIEIKISLKLNKTHEVGTLHPSPVKLSIAVQYWYIMWLPLPCNLQLPQENHNSFPEYQEGCGIEARIDRPFNFSQHVYV